MFDHLGHGHWYLCEPISDGRRRRRDGRLFSSGGSGGRGHEIAHGVQGLLDLCPGIGCACLWFGRTTTTWVCQFCRCGGGDTIGRLVKGSLDGIQP